jgi:hypothetical protein
VPPAGGTGGIGAATFGTGITWVAPGGGIVAGGGCCGGGSRSVAAARARRISYAVWKRWAGSFAIERSTTPARAGVTSGRNWRIGGG